MGDIVELPSSVSEWQAATSTECLEGAGINNGPLVGAHRLNYRRFLPLRIIWKNIPAVAFDPKMFDLDGWMGRAADVLKDYQSWHTYNRSFYGRPGEGNFTLASVFQAQARQVQGDNFGDKVVFRNGAASSSETSNLLDDIPLHELEKWARNKYKYSTSGMDPTINANWHRRYLETEFEPTIKNALVLFLNALTMSVPDLGVEWVMSGKKLMTKFDLDTVNYKVHVDAFMKGKNHDRPRILVDVREPRRSEMPSEIRIQESAQMVAWLMTSPDPAHRRIIISQDEGEIFLTFAEYGEPYMRYLDSNGDINVNSSDPESFLTMYEVGPFNTNYQPAMSKLGAIILALVLRDAQYIFKGPEIDERTFPQGQILFGDLTAAEMYGPPYQTLNTGI